jgi:hypothetical protein
LMPGDISSNIQIFIWILNFSANGHNSYKVVPAFN